MTSVMPSKLKSFASLRPPPLFLKVLPTTIESCEAEIKIVEEMID